MWLSLFATHWRSFKLFNRLGIDHIHRDPGLWKKYGICDEMPLVCHLSVVTMFLASSCSCLCPIHWSHVLIREWRCSWSSTDRRCSNYMWVINTCISNWCAIYTRGLKVRRFQQGYSNDSIICPQHNSISLLNSWLFTNVWRVCWIFMGCSDVSGDAQGWELLSLFATFHQFQSVL